MDAVPKAKTTTTGSVPAVPAAVAALDVLVGQWEWNGGSGSGQGAFIVKGHSSCQWHTGGHFLVENAEVNVAGRVYTTIAVIGFSAPRKTCVAHVYDNAGGEHEYEISILGDQLCTMWDEYKFVGTISDDRATIQGEWFLLSQENEWEHWFDLTMRRVG